MLTVPAAAGQSCDQELPMQVSQTHSVPWHLAASPSCHSDYEDSWGRGKGMAFSDTAKMG